MSEHKSFGPGLVKLSNYTRVVVDAAHMRDWLKQPGVAASASQITGIPESEMHEIYADKAEVADTDNDAHDPG